MKLKTQLILALTFVAFVCVLAISIAANIELRIHFHAYLSQIQMEQGMSGYEPVYSDFDRHFIQTINRVFWMMGVAVLLLAAGIGTLLANRIHKPIEKAIDATIALANGKRQVTVDQSRTNVVELGQLNDAVTKLAESLTVQEQLRKQLTANVAHELRTPLATLKSHIELMMEGVWQPTEARLSSCYEEIDRLTRLISDLDQLERYDLSIIKLNKATIHARQLISQVTTLMLPKFELKGLKLSTQVEDFEFQADSDKVIQILVNLLHNALRYTQSGEVIIMANATAQKAIIKVKDTGIGIPTEAQEHIFERFYRVDPSRTRETGGTGIGLSIVKAIVEAHCGEIAVESQIEKGTTFTIQLPLREGDVSVHE